MGVGMMDELARGLESHFMTAVFVSGALALLIAASVGLAWAGGRRWVRSRSGMSNLGTGRTMHFSTDRGTPRPSAGNPEPESAPGTPELEHPGARFVREAAARAATLRDAWDRSYREARGTPPAPKPEDAHPDLESLIQELLREQRETNALLRQLLDSQEAPPR